MKIYCASDFHIGYEHANYSKIKEFLQLVKENADQLILCGDILDLWRCPVERIKKKEPMKSTYKALISVSKDVPTKIIWGNHDYHLEKKVKIPIGVSDDFKSKNIYYCHGWRFDLQQRFGYFLYGWLVNRFPYLYQKFFTKPFEIKKKEKEYSELSKQIHNEARAFIKKEKVKYLIMGHTHDPLAAGKLFDCGDMIDSLSYVIIDNGKPGLKRMPRD